MQLRIQTGPRLCRAISLLVLGIIAPRLISAQTIGHTASQAGRGAASGLLSSDEGLTILAAALESRHHADSRLDCSHLIHAIYERAGFPYTYASSSDLYDGTGDFRRVTRPQTGDLIVWRGHVGIVISGTQHTFFSALRSGRGVESYDSKYWKRRGQPRFFRYVRTTPTLYASNRGAGLKPAELRNAAAREPIAAVAASPDDSNDPEPPSITQLLPEFSVPQVQVVHASRPKPEDVIRALVSAYNAAAQGLEARDLFQLSQSVIVFDDLKVRKVQLKRDQGWAEVEIGQPTPILSVNSTAKKHSERHHWGLVRKDRDSWELALPPNTIYVAREAAVRIVAHQLTTLTDTDPTGNRDRKVQLARLLNTLLNTSADVRR
jgi:hypothetical protein